VRDMVYIYIYIHNIYIQMKWRREYTARYQIINRALLLIIVLFSSSSSSVFFFSPFLPRLLFRIADHLIPAQPDPSSTSALPRPQRTRSLEGEISGYIYNSSLYLCASSIPSPIARPNTNTDTIFPLAQQGGRPVVSESLASETFSWNRSATLLSPPISPSAKFAPASVFPESRSICLIRV
jgi:hypothetical protein